MSDALAQKQAEALERLRERFRATTSNTLDALRALGQRLADRPDAPEVLDALRRELHRVHGTAGSYGFAEASRLAGSMEERAVLWARDPDLESGQRATLVAQLVTELGLAFHERADGSRDVASRAVRTVVVAGVSAERVTEMRAEGALRDYRVASLTLEQAQAAILRDLAPHAIAVPTAAAPGVAAVAWMLGIPVVAMEWQGRAEREPGALAQRGGIVFADVAGDYSAVFDAADRTATLARGGATILALDDDPAIVAMVKLLLEGPDLGVHTLTDSSQLGQALETLMPSLLLMDISMPGADGVALTLRLRADPRYATLPIILLSAETDVLSREVALTAGADEFISKPISHSELRSRVADRLGRLRLERLSSMLHPLTGFAVAPRAAREAEAALTRLSSGAAEFTLVSVRPAAGEDGGTDSPAWLRETMRIVAALHGHVLFAGHADDCGLVLILALSTTAAAERLRALGAAMGGGRWCAGLVGRGDVAGPDFERARMLAVEAADVAHGAGETVHRWQPDESLVAPDVIVVEDDPALSEMMQYALRSNGFTFRAFANGRLALDYLLVAKSQGRRPIVLLDVDLPGIDGYSLHEQLAVARAGDYAVVFVTVHGGESDQLRALKGGAIDFILKPLNLRILMAKMGSWAAAARAGSRR